jgi:hypothetical protein
MKKPPKAIREYLSKIGKKGGEVKSPAKAKAAKRNAKKAGRKRKSDSCARCGVPWAEHKPCR